jgi:predicted glycoside hydrolase/deacetylase ChbG (UPF0249 family)
VYATERLTELDTLCDPTVGRALEAQGIVLRSFAELNHLRNAAR